MRTPAPTFDVLGLGAVTVDELIYVDAFPPADVKTRVRHRERQCGGLTATALVAAARLGARCAYAGVLGTDQETTWAVAQLEAEQIDFTYLRREDAVHPVRSLIIVGEQGQTRNVFADSRAFTGPTEDWPPAEVISRAKVLLLDHFGLPGMIRAAGIARASGVAVVADAERESGPLFSEWLALSDHLILSASFAQAVTKSATVEAAIKQLWNAARRVVALTDGAKGCWFTDDGASIRHQAAFPVKALDTTGCGDVFHGAYAAALARGLPAGERIRMASVSAALKATRLGGQAGAPTKIEVERALASPPPMA